MKRRSGFTLVELMVAMALIMFIMAILSEAFGAAMKSFRDLKASADMAERLRAAGTMLRRELSADHFDGKARMSQPDFWANGPRRKASSASTRPPPRHLKAPTRTSLARPRRNAC